MTQTTTGSPIAPVPVAPQSGPITATSPDGLVAVTVKSAVHSATMWLSTTGAAAAAGDALLNGLVPILQSALTPGPAKVALAPLLGRLLLSSFLAGAMAIVAYRRKVQNTVLR